MQLIGSISFSGLTNATALKGSFIEDRLALNDCDVTKMKSAVSTDSLSISCSLPDVAPAAIKIWPIPKGIDAAKIYGVFKAFGRIKDCTKGIRIVRAGGYALVDYATAVDAENCLRHAATQPILLGSARLRVETFSLSDEASPVSSSDVSSVFDGSTTLIFTNSSRATATVAGNRRLPRQLYAKPPERTVPLFERRFPVPRATKPEFNSSDALQIRNVDPSLISIVLLKEYFEKGANAEITGQMIEKDYHWAALKFKDIKGVERVLGKLAHTVDGQSVYVSALPPLSPRQILVRNVPPWAKQRLDDYLVGRAKMDVENIIFSASATTAIVTYQGSVDISMLRSRFSERPMVRSAQAPDVFSPVIAGVRLPDAALISDLPVELLQLGKSRAKYALRNAVESSEPVWSGIAKGVSVALRHVLLSQEKRQGLVIFDSYKGAELFLSHPFVLHSANAKMGDSGCISSQGNKPVQLRMSVKPFYDAIDTFDFT